MKVTDEHLKSIVNSAFGYAKQMFEEFGDFYPFGMSLNSDGEVEMLGTMKVDEKHDSPDFVLMLQKKFREEAQAGDIFAAAIGANVDIPAQLPADFPDGIGVFLEAEGIARAYYLPYKVERDRRGAEDNAKLSVSYGQPIGIEIPPAMFVGENPA
jgi:hypothetical protein